MLHQYPVYMITVYNVQCACCAGWFAPFIPCHQFFSSVRLTTDFEQTRIAFVYVCVQCTQMLPKMNTKTACFMSIFLVDPIKIYITSIAIVLGLFSQQAEKMRYTLVGLVFILLYFVSRYARDICFVSCATKQKCFEMWLYVCAWCKY